VMLYLNRARTVAEQPVLIVPGPGQAGLGLLGRF